MDRTKPTIFFWLVRKCSSEIAVGFPVGRNCADESIPTDRSTAFSNTAASVSFTELTAGKLEAKINSCKILVPITSSTSATCSTLSAMDQCAGDSLKFNCASLSPATADSNSSRVLSRYPISSCLSVGEYIVIATILLAVAVLRVFHGVSHSDNHHARRRFARSDRNSLRQSLRCDGGVGNKCSGRPLVRGQDGHSPVVLPANLHSQGFVS